ncbi:BTB/POZ domain-containing protein 1-like isoform X2 [Paramacrobiotus metropolitanus]|uniref:BTB/POZ domain-containing protein 1-like isoform X2 n=1 Tax=Paramacrobiotus metropolitanus TaxID=2943436 RepID=UPI002445C78A|nr:BTB/POZ domain-containing protein 1-like isoform X2 [Paramacrobiotus metropolitanus]
MSKSSAESSKQDNRGDIGKIAECLRHMLACGESSDVQFAAGRQYGAVQMFSAHRLIMGARSFVFHTMFYGSIPEDCSVPLDIPDIHPDAFANMLSFIYTDTVENLNSDNVFHTLSCADKYDLSSLVGLCTRFIVNGLNMDSCLEILEKANRHTCESPSVTEECLRLIDESREHVWQSDYFSAIRQETLLMILQRETLAAEEQIIYSSVEKWAVNACIQNSRDASAVNRRAMLGPALYLVRFPLLTNEQLMAGPAKTGLLLQSELWDIFRYKHDTVKPPIPFIGEPRQIHAIYYTIPDVRLLPENTMYSNPVTIRKLQWKIRIKKNDDDSTFLGFYLRCDYYPKSTPWTCRVRAELRLLPWKAGTAPVKRGTLNLSRDLPSVQQSGPYFGIPEIYLYEGITGPHERLRQPY